MFTCLVLFSPQGPKKTITNKRESKEKREIIEESKENLKAKSDDSGEEKNGDDDSQKNGPKKKGECGSGVNLTSQPRGFLAACWSIISLK